MKDSAVTIVAYHYVRPLADTPYPEIKGLDLAAFRSQVKYLKKNYEIISVEDLLGYLDSNTPLPKNAALLTFDDGYKDHYEYVVPVFREEKITGAFFVPGEPVVEKKVLTPNKLHFTLASGADPSKIIQSISTVFEKNKDSYQLQDWDHYIKEFFFPFRYDPAEIIFIKRMLQFALPDELRYEIAGSLFREFVTDDEAAFSEELYVTPSQMREMQDEGMHIGSHGYAHYWLGTLSREKQEKDIERSIDFLKEAGCGDGARTICYPFGSFNDDTIEILHQKSFRLGFINHEGVADLSATNILKLPRFDTNSFPKN